MNKRFLRFVAVTYVSLLFTFFIIFIHSNPKNILGVETVTESQGIEVHEPDSGREKQQGIRVDDNDFRTYENIRRGIEFDLKELLYNFKNIENNPEFNQIQDVYRTVKSGLVKLRGADGYEKIREQETLELSNLVQKRLHLLQNPASCESAKKLICTINKGCGFGCEIHHAAYCLIVAYATSRTLILQSSGWSYSPGGWEEIFMPLSNTCTDEGPLPHYDFNPNDDNLETPVITLPFVDFVSPLPSYLPEAIPADIAERLESLHGEPHIWWVGQMMQYILRLQPEIHQRVYQNITWDRSSPTVGVHVRRRDKIGSEADFHSLEEYMKFVADYYEVMEKVDDNIQRRRVFIASDDPTVISEAYEKYSPPQWEILGDQEIATSGAGYDFTGLLGIIIDVFTLAECDYLVCTFSSQVCRLAYELMQSKHADASGRFYSLDSFYYYGGGNGLSKVVILPHQPRNDNEIELVLGDEISLDNNLLNGMSRGTNHRTGKNGLYPSYKAKTIPRPVDFPQIKWWERK